MNIIINNSNYNGKNWFTETNVSELEKCLEIANKETSANYQQIDKYANVLEILTDIPLELINEIPVQQLTELFKKLTTEINHKDLEIVNEWEGYVSKGFETYSEITANRAEFRNFEKHLKKRTKRYISHIMATFFSVEGETYEYHYSKKLADFKEMPSKVAIPYVFRAMEIILETTDVKVDADSKEVQEAPEM